MGVFDTSRCPVADVPPISALPAIVDCGVPPSPPPAIDCPDIEIPPTTLPATNTATSIPGMQGPPGAPGPQGEPGMPGSCPCLSAVYEWNGLGWVLISNPCVGVPPAPLGSGFLGERRHSCCPYDFRVTYSSECVYTDAEVNVALTATPVGPCRTDLNFDFLFRCLNPLAVISGEGCGVDVANVTTLQMGAQGGCCDFFVAPDPIDPQIAVIRPEGLRGRWAKALASSSGDSVLAEDLHDHAIITLPLLSIPMRQPNVRAGDLLAYVLTDGCGLVVVSDYQDAPIGTVRPMSWTAGELSGQHADMNTRGWFLYGDLAGKFPIGWSPDGLDFDGLGLFNDLLPGSTGGIKNHTHPDHLWIHTHGAAIQATHLDIVADNLVTRCAPANLLVDTEGNPGEGGGGRFHQMHQHHTADQLHQIYFTPQNTAGDNYFSVARFYAAGACFVDGAPGNLVILSDALVACEIAAFFDHTLVDPPCGSEETGHVHHIVGANFSDHVFVTWSTGSEYVHADHNHPIEVHPQTMTFTHTVANHIPPYRATIWIVRLN